MRRFFLGRLNAFDFSAGERTIAFVKIRDLQQVRVAKFAGRVSKQQIRQISAAFEVKIHCQEREIVRDVDETEPVVELDAIEDRQPVRREVNVVEVEIAMAIADSMLLHSLEK